MRPERRRMTKTRRRQVFIFIIIVIGTLLLLGLFFWLFKPFGGSYDGPIYGYRYAYY